MFPRLRGRGTRRRACRATGPWARAGRAGKAAIRQVAIDRCNALGQKLYFGFGLGDILAQRRQRGALLRRQPARVLRGLLRHDRHLMDASADRLWIVRGGTVQTYDGDMDSYRTECLAERGADPNAPRPKANGAAKQTAQDARRLAAEQRAALAPLRKNVTKAEAEIELLSKRIAAIDRDLADGGLYRRDPARAQALSRERGGLVRAREDAETAWLHHLGSLRVRAGAGEGSAL